MLSYRAINLLPEVVMLERRYQIVPRRFSVDNMRHLTRYCASKDGRNRATNMPYKASLSTYPCCEMVLDSYQAVKNG